MQDTRHDISFRKELRQVIGKCRHNYRKILIAVASALIMAGAYIALRRPVYTANASVMIANDMTAGSTAMSLVRQFSLGNMLGGSGSVHDELSMIASHTTVSGAVKQLGINTSYIVKENILSRVSSYPESPVILECAPSIPDTLRSALIFKLKVASDGRASVKVRRNFSTIGSADGQLPLSIETSYGKFVIIPTEHMTTGKPLKMTIRTTGYSRAAEELSKKLQIDIPSKLADVVSLSYECDNRQLATDVLQALIDEYNRRGIETKRARDMQTLSFIDDRLARLTDELSESEHGIEAFKQKNRLSDLKAEAEYMLGERTTLDQELLKAETNAQVLSLTKEFIDDPANSYNFIPVLGLSDNDAKAIASYNELILQRMNLEKSALKGNPALERLNRQIDGMRDAVKKSVERSVENARIAVEKLSVKNRSSQARLDAVPSQERIFRDIMRRQTVQEQLMIFLMEQREETSLNMVNTMGRGEIIDEPYLLTLDTENSPAVVLMAAFVTGLLIMPLKWYFSSVISATKETSE